MNTIDSVNDHFRVSIRAREYRHFPMLLLYNIWSIILKIHLATFSLFFSCKILLRFYFDKLLGLHVSGHDFDYASSILILQYSATAL